MKYIIAVLIVLFLFIAINIASQSTEFEYEHMNVSNDTIKMVITDDNGNLSATDLELYKIGVPIGAIVMWSGTLATIPKGWALCNGSVVNGFNTPDLRGRFIVGINPLGAGQSSANDSAGQPLSVYELNQMGGEGSHTLTVAEMPSHVHSGVQNQESCKNVSASGTSGCWMAGPMFPRNTDPIGGNQPHNNLPPYYALAYIVKVV